MQDIDFHHFFHTPLVYFGLAMHHVDLAKRRDGQPLSTKLSTGSGRATKSPMNQGLAT
ncbi:hypothetical protein [Comamonas faecalis]|uniref:hypothetical protein n=1 Tax=Comamonas faecalis TaxID=1387849 RepID=UPI0031E52AAB